MQALLGAEAVITDPAERALAAADILPAADAVPPDLVLRPRSTDQTAAAMRLLAAAGIPIVPRGAGLSYTGGVVPRSPSVVIDTAALDSVTVVAEDLYAIVGAGCSWEKLAAALKPHGLRPAPSPPISGSHSTIGGAAAQGVTGSEGIIGLAVVLADGSVVRTGTWTTPGAVPFGRHYGPDLTGLFIGDCGAFGVKTEIVVRLLPPTQKRFASFGFSRGVDVVTAIGTLQRGPGGKALAFDRARAADATGKMELGEVLRTAAAVAGSAGSMGQALKGVIGLARAKGEIAEAPWSLHITAEGATAAIADAQLDAMRRICLDAGGTKIAPAVPQALDARPFSVRGMVGQSGERWVPVHGNLPLSAAPGCLTAIEAYLAGRAEEIRTHGIRINWLILSMGAYITMEPMFYWCDALDPLHLKYLSERNRSRFGHFPANPAARAFADALRASVRDLMDSHGATHNQIGRFYAPPSGNMLHRLKAALDPHGRMNPGVLAL
ncbi:MAG: FAD-binding oxidoreductase [Acetobacteraceae bacterium]